MEAKRKNKFKLIADGKLSIEGSTQVFGDLPSPVNNHHVIRKADNRLRVLVLVVSLRMNFLI